MTRKTIIKILIFVTAMGLISCSESTQEKVKSGSESFEGRWALYLPGGAGWLEVRQEEGYLDGEILWYAGSVTPVSSMLLKNDTLIVTRNRNVVRKRDADNNATRTQVLTSWIECSLNNGKLIGKALMPGRDNIRIIRFTGERIPPLPPAPDLSKIRYGKPISLFNGKDTAGWILTNEDQSNGFIVEEGVLINDPVQKEGQPRIRYGNIKTVEKFEDFNLTVDVNIPKGSNSGIYLRGIYEVQIVDSYQKSLDSHNMGAVYSRITPSLSAEKPAGEWQSFDIILCKRHVSVALNGKMIIDNQPLFGITGGALTPDELAPGPIYLQGDHGKVLFRNIILKPILN